MNEQLLKKIAAMTPEQLERFKHFVEFFELLGVNEQDLINAVALIKGYPELISKANAIIATQKDLEKRIHIMLNSPKEDVKQLNAVDEFNKESAILNPYAK